MKSQENESGKPYRSLRKRHAAVSGISVPSERNLQLFTFRSDFFYNLFLFDRKTCK